MPSGLGDQRLRLVPVDQQRWWRTKMVPQILTSGLDRFAAPTIRPPAGTVRGSNLLRRQLHHRSEPVCGEESDIPIDAGGIHGEASSCAWS